MTDETQSAAPEPSSPLAGARTLARVGAVVLALSVVAYLIYRAQSQAGAEQPSSGNPVVGNPVVGNPAVGNPAVGPSAGGELAPGTVRLSDQAPPLLPSSKFRVISDGAFVQPQVLDKGEADPVVLPSSKSLVLDPKAVVLPKAEGGFDPSLLFSSKSGVPIPAPTESAVGKKGQDSKVEGSQVKAKPNAKGGK